MSTQEPNIENPTGLSKSALKKLKKQQQNSTKPKMSKEEKLALFSKKKEVKITNIEDSSDLKESLKNLKIGLKKPMEKDLDSSYNSVNVESHWYEWWESQGYFKPNSFNKNIDPKDLFVVCLPPPNVTGTLHLGHALTSAIQDSLVRYHRMKGHQTLYLPGTDHAGIATQSVVEKSLYKTNQTTRHDLGREDFLKKVWEWKEEKGSTIVNQLRKTASSLDWSREFFTMDEDRSIAVKEAFYQFYKSGKIYRDTRLVNWCPHLKTALSDLEVEYIDITGRHNQKLPGGITAEVGVLVYFKYALKEDDTKFLTVATTRLETMLGDVAVAVHPNDERYMDMIGKELVHPFFPDRKVVVIADDYVDAEFGTGAVKITPAHDPNDFAIGRRHGLDEINVLSDNGTIFGCGPDFDGQHRFIVRKLVEKKLTEWNLFVKKIDHPLRLGLCSRSGDIVEPMLKPQWWMNCDDLAAKAVKLVEDGDLVITPTTSNHVWFNWLRNIKDWCISRQLWWGHRIPAYKVTSVDNQPITIEKWVVGRSMDEAISEAKSMFKTESNNIILEQDEDVLDTWFSSGLLPMSGLGWPNNQHLDMSCFFPTSVLETGHDILFFWVARMVMMSLGLTGKCPFHTVYLHPIIRDAHGRKMSKSLGNVIDPLEIVNGASLEELINKLKLGNLDPKEIATASATMKKDYPKGIPKCGSDALRFGLLSYLNQTTGSINLDVSRLFGYRRFCNKVWNGVKFAYDYYRNLSILNTFQSTNLINLLNIEFEQFEDKWIFERLNEMLREVESGFDNYDIAKSVSSIHSFWIYDFCDVYVEIAKHRSSLSLNTDVCGNVLFAVCNIFLRSAHPVLPFITEELAQTVLFPTISNEIDTIMLSEFPTSSSLEQSESVEKMNTLRGIITFIRSCDSKDIDKFYIECKDSSLSIDLRIITALVKKEVLIMDSTDGFSLIRENEVLKVYK